MSDDLGEAGPNQAGSGEGPCLQGTQSTKPQLQPTALSPGLAGRTAPPLVVRTSGSLLAGYRATGGFEQRRHGPAQNFPLATPASAHQGTSPTRRSHVSASLLQNPSKPNPKSPPLCPFSTSWPSGLPLLLASMTPSTSLLSVYFTVALNSERARELLLFPDAQHGVCPFTDSQWE